MRSETKIHSESNWIGSEGKKEKRFLRAMCRNIKRQTNTKSILNQNAAPVIGNFTLVTEVQPTTEDS